MGNTVLGLPHTLIFAFFLVAASGCTTPEQISRMSDSEVCAGALETWPNYGSPRFALDGRGGMFAHAARARGYLPLDCHFSTSECLEYGFERGSKLFNQCRLQLVIDHRQSVRAQETIRALRWAPYDTYDYGRFRHSGIHGYSGRPSSDMNGHNKKRHSKRSKPKKSSDDQKLSVNAPTSDGPVSKVVKKFQAKKLTPPQKKNRLVRAPKTADNQRRSNSARNAKRTVKEPVYWNPTVDSIANARKQMRTQSQ